MYRQTDSGWTGGWLIALLASSLLCLSLLNSPSYLAMSSGLRRKWRRAVRALGMLRGTGGDEGGAVSELLFLVSPPSRG